MEKIILDTLGKLAERRWQLSGSCTDCALRYRMDLPAGQNVPAEFSIDLQQLIAERGAGMQVVGMKPPRCPRCGSASTRLIVQAPERLNGTA